MGLITFWRTQAVTLRFSPKSTFEFAQAHDRLIDCQNLLSFGGQSGNQTKQKSKNSDDDFRAYLTIFEHILIGNKKCPSPLPICLLSIQFYMHI